MSRTCVFQLKGDGFVFKKESNSLCLTGPPAQNETIVLFRATLNTPASRELSARELAAFKEAAANWDQRARLGFFVLDLHDNHKLVSVSTSSRTNLSVATSICIFYSNGVAQAILKKINDDRDITKFCIQTFERVKGAVRNPEPGSFGPIGTQVAPQRNYYKPEGMVQPSTNSLRIGKPVTDHENSLTVPENIIPYNTPWKHENL
jgi:hypothetical protein